ncbi:conjugal transfer relaxosome DNA-binding protein TraM (plasmid) [Klebsiella pneumoniae]
MARVQAYASDEVAEKINAIVEKRRAEGAKEKDVSFSSVASMLLELGLRVYEAQMERKDSGFNQTEFNKILMDLRESQGWLSRGYEGAVTGAALGAGITAYNSSSAGATLGVGLAAGLVGMAADAMVEDVNYTMITDVQIAERTKTQVQTDNVAVLRQGTSGAKVQTSTETGNQHKYQTRVVSNANKVNLKFPEAQPVLEDQLAKSIANIL